MRFFTILLVTLLAVIVSPAQTSEPNNLVRNGDFAQGIFGWVFNNFGDKDAATAVVVDAKAGPFQHAVQITSKLKVEDKPWSVQLLQRIEAEIAMGDPLTLKVWLRSQTGNKIRLFVRESQEPYADSISQVLTLTPQWQEYEFQGIARQDYDLSEMQVGLNLGYGPGEIEIASVRLLHVPSVFLRPKLDLQIGHSSSVEAVAFSPDGKILASGGGDRKIKLWDAATGILRRTLTSQIEGISGLAFSSDGRLLASGGDKTVNLWDSQSGVLQRTFQQENFNLNTIAFAPDGKTLAIGGWLPVACGTLKIGVDNLTSEQATRLKVAGGVLVLGTGSGLAKSGLKKDDVIISVGGKNVFTAKALWDEIMHHSEGEHLVLKVFRDGKTLEITLTLEKGDRSVGEIRILNAISGTPLHIMKNLGAGVNSIAFSSDGRLMASGGGDEIEAADMNAQLSQLTSEDAEKQKIKGGLIVVAEVIPGGAAEKAGLQKDDVIQQINHKPVTRVSEVLSLLNQQPIGVPVIVGIARKGDVHEVPVTLEAAPAMVGGIRFWKADSGSPLHTVKSYYGTIRTVAFAPDNKSLASRSWDTVQLWDVKSGKVQRTMPRSEASFAMAFSPDGLTIASGTGYNNVSLWNLQTGVLESTQTGRDNWSVDTVAFSPDGRIVAGGSGDGSILLWDAQTKTLRQALGGIENIYAIAISPDGRTLASGGSLNRVRLWDTATGELRQTLKGHDWPIMSITFAPDGRTLATSSPDRTNLWDVETGALRREINQPQDKVVRLWMFSMPRRVAFSPDSKTLATGSDDNIIKLWDVATGQVQKSLNGHSDVVRAVVFSPDGKMLASASNDKTIKLWNVSNGQEISTLKDEVNRYAASIEFSPDSTTLAVGANQGVNLWDVQTGALQRKMDGEGGNVTVAFSPDSKILAGAYLSRDVFFWNPQTGAKQRMLRRVASVEGLVFSPDGRRVFTANWDSTVRVWDASNGRLIGAMLALPQSREAPINDSPANQKIEADNDYLVLTPEGYYSGSAAADRYVRFKLGDDSFPAESFQARYYRPDLVKRKLAGEEVPPIGEFHGPFPPVAKLALSRESGQNSVTVNVAATDDSEIKSIAFFVNGARIDAKPLTAESRPLTADAKSLTADSRPLTAESRTVPEAHKVLRRYTATLPLPSGATNIKIQAIAFDDDGLQSPREEILFSREATAAMQGKLLGLCVGISHYQDTRLNLKFADADANALARTLGAQRGIYSEARVNALTNENATAGKIKSEMDALIQSSTRADTIILSLSGHGWRDEGRSFYFANYEVNRNDVAKTALTWQEITNRLTQLSQKSKRVIVLLDACHSGSAATNEELVKAILSSNAGVLVFASSRGSEVSLENTDWQHGAFTKALIEAIEGKAAPPGEKSVTMIDFIAYVSRRVKTLTEDQQHPQVPFLQDFDTDAALMQKP